MYRGGHDDKGTWTKEAVQFLCTLIKRIDNLQELIDDANIATNKTNSSFKIQEDIKEAQRELKEYVESIVSQRLRTEIVPTLPDLTMIKENVIYMTPIPKLDENGNPTGGSDGYNQYMFINGKIEYLGGTKISLTDYYTKQESNMLHAQLEDKIDENKVLIGSITAYAGQTAPEGYMICDGSTLNKADYPELFDVIGTVYGGDGVTTFKLPDLRTRVIAGFMDDDEYFGVLGKTGGEKTHALATNEMPSHNHTFTGNVHSHNMSSNNSTANNSTSSGGSHSHSYSTYSYSNYNPDGHNDTGDHYLRYTETRSTSTDGYHSHSVYCLSAIATGTIGNTGHGFSHNNLQPYMVLNYIIRVK